MGTMNWNETYGKLTIPVNGYDGAIYRQSGKYYDASGNRVMSEAEKAEIEKRLKDKTGLLERNDPLAGLDEDMPVSEPGDREATYDQQSLDKLHWKALKSLVEEKGGEWTNKQDAIDFLTRK